MNGLTTLVFSGFWATNLLAQAPPDTIKSEDTMIALPDSHATQHFKILSKNALKESMLEAQKEKQTAALKLQNHSSIAKLTTDESVQRLEEIRVFGNVEPEDYVAPKPPPMLVFRAMLDKQRPRTIAEKLLRGCFICPQEPEPEGNVVDRFDAKKFERPLIIARPRGSFQ